MFTLKAQKMPIRQAKIKSSDWMFINFSLEWDENVDDLLRSLRGKAVGSMLRRSGNIFCCNLSGHPIILLRERHDRIAHRS